MKQDTDGIRSCGIYGNALWDRWPSAFWWPRLADGECGHDVQGDAQAGMAGLYATYTAE